jgi:predicted HAD superfamily Cof-like phosphohydrolase
MVAEFMQHIGSETPDHETDREPAVAGVRMSLIMEELCETHAAMLRSDLVEVADGLADTKYVIIGTAVAYGLPINDFFYAPFPVAAMPDAVSAASLMLAATPWLKDVAYALAGREDLGKALRGLDVALSMEAAVLGLPLRELFAEVHRSNMTKEPGYCIGAAKYGPGGGKSTKYSQPDIAGILAKVSGAEL